MPTTTGTIGMTQAGDVLEYIPPNVVDVTPAEPPPPPGPTVTYGDPQTIAAGDPLGIGIWDVQTDGLEATEDVTVRSVTITEST